MLGTIKGFLKRGWANLTDIKSIEEALDVDLAISQAMLNSISLWDSVYRNKAPWLNKQVKGRQLAPAICSEFTRLITSKMEINAEGNTQYAEFVQDTYDTAIAPYLDTNLEYGVAKGGFVVKPYLSDGSVRADFVQAGAFFPIAFSSSGEITDVVFTDTHQKGDITYTRLERHKLEDIGGDLSCVITNLTYRKDKYSDRGSLGTPVPITEIDIWADIEPETIMYGVNRLVLAHFNVPVSNNVDTSCPLGISVFSRAIDQLEKLDKLDHNYHWEFESGKRKLYVNRNGLAVDPKTKERQTPNEPFYQLTQENPENNKLHSDSSPIIRVDELSKGVNDTIQAIEDLVGLARGTFSNLPNTTIAKTAEEIKTSKQRSFHTVTRLQTALDHCLREFFAAVDLLVSMDKESGTERVLGVDTEDITVTIAFGDNVLEDKDAEAQRYLQLLTANVVKPYEVRMLLLGENEDTAKANVPDAPQRLFEGGY